MSSQNVVSIQIPNDKVTEMQGHITALQTLLEEYLIAMSAQERHDLLKMNDKTVPFVEKTLEYTKTDPKFVPNYMDAREFEVDYNAVETLKTFYIPLSQLCSNLSDTIMLSGSEAYDAALTYYSTVKEAAKKNVPGAKTIKEDLGKRFVKATKKMDPMVP